MREKEGTKLCKHCKTEIPAGAKICPNCRKKQGLSGCLIIIIAFIVLGVIGAALGGGDDTDDKKQSSSINASTSISSEGAVVSNEPEEKEPEIVYTSYSVSEMMSDLNSNPMNASDKYKEQYIEITGRLNVIDSDGKYISLVPDDSQYAILGVTCYIKTDEQKEAIKSMSIGDTVTLQGQCISVGEVLGYSLNIDNINQ